MMMTMTVNTVMEIEQVALLKASLRLLITREVKVKEGSKKKSFLSEEMLSRNSTQLQTASTCHLIVWRICSQWLRGMVDCFYTHEIYVILHHYRVSTWFAPVNSKDWPHKVIDNYGLSTVKN
jgi:hypothetical protein